MISPLADPVLFHIGPAPITSAVAVTWGLMAFLAGGAFWATRKLITVRLLFLWSLAFGPA